MAGADPRTSFGAVAEQYERGRPDYPEEAVAWLTAGARTAVELGAGTGKLTQSLTGHVGRVLATDPDERMLHHLQRRVPGIPTAVAVAEAVPLPDRSTDVVLAAQAFHWFDLTRAVPEIARVLSTGGVLALVWNDRDEGVPWVRKLGRMIGTTEDDDVGASLEPFDEVLDIEQQTFRHWQDHDRDSLLAMVASRSYVSTLPEEEREERLAQVSSLYDDYGRGPDGMRLPYLTRCYRVRMAARQPATAPAPAEHRATEAEEEWGEPTQAIDRADLPLGRREEDRPDDPDLGPSLIDFR